MLAEEEEEQEEPVDGEVVEVRVVVGALGGGSTGGRRSWGEVGEGGGMGATVVKVTSELLLV